MNFIVIGYLFYMAAALLHLLATILPYWKTNDPSGAVVEWREVNIGLWHKCTGYSTGIFSCDDFDSFWLGQQPEVTTARAGMCVALFLDLLVFVCFQIASPWTTCATSDVKQKVMKASTACVFISTIVVAGCTGYYGSRVLNDYFTMSGLYNRDRGRLSAGGSYAGGDTMKFGGSLYSSWISVIFGFISGFMLCCCMKDAIEEDEDEYYDTSVGAMHHNNQLTHAPPPGVAPSYHRETALPNANFEMAPRAKKYEHHSYA